ncbi:MAG: Fic family protein [Alphaproteobacteria bacterium]|nr:Fic family protein [Alphaproteobacteria bacterium]
MTETGVQRIWNPETGILDLDGDPSRLGASEIPGIKAVWKQQHDRLKGTRQLSDFTERLSREWAIETGVIENLYDIERGVTQTLIERGFQAELLTHGSTNRPHHYVIQLLRDQKDALDGVFDFIKQERTLSVSYIKELHAALLNSQQVTEGMDSQGRFVEIPLLKGQWKMQANYPVRDGVTYTYCAPEHVAAEMDRLVDLHAKHSREDVPSDVKAAWLHHRFTQIHPFQDGNGRVARAIASLVLVKDGLFPLIITRDEKTAYIDALEQADNNNLKPLIELIVKLQIVQFRKASGISESMLQKQDVGSIIRGLTVAAARVAEQRQKSLKRVFELAQSIVDNLKDRLDDLVPDITQALITIEFGATVNVMSSTAQTDHWYRAQIVQNAKFHLGYFADTSEYRSWVSLNMRWSRQAKLVFSLHGIGRPFNGSLICAPFMEFRDHDEEGEMRVSFVPVAQEGFVFFYNETESRLLERFADWRESVLKVAFEELSRNL